MSELVDSTSPQGTTAPDILDAARNGRLRWRPREYASGDVSGFALVIVATNDRAVNPRVAAEALERGVRVGSERFPGVVVDR
ncbi:MAG TPA: NAD(P)-dependent oxidoreductase [Methylomirabilota bacterium]